MITSSTFAYIVQSTPCTNANAKQSNFYDPSGIFITDFLDPELAWIVTKIRGFKLISFAEIKAKRLNEYQTLLKLKFGYQHCHSCNFSSAINLPRICSKIFFFFFCGLMKGSSTLQIYHKLCKIIASLGNSPLFE